MDDSTLCTGKTSCTSFGVIIFLLFVAMFFNYILRCIQSSHTSGPPASLLVTTTNTTTTTQNTLLSIHSPLYRHAINSMPVVAYDPAIHPNNYSSPSSSSSNNNNNSNDNSNSEKFDSENCAICLAEFEVEEKVRVLPKCKHVYHVECIDQWLRRSLYCPICRERVVDQQIHAKLLSTDQHLGVRSNHNVNNNNNNDPQAPSFVLNIGNAHATVFI